MKKSIITALLALGMGSMAQAAVVNITNGSATDYTVGTDNVGTPDATGTYTITGTVTDTGRITVVAKEGGASYTNAYFYGNTGSANGNMNPHSLVEYSGGGTQSAISNADITISGNYEMRNTDLTQSSVTITNRATLTSAFDSNKTLRLGTLTVGAGSKVTASGGAKVTYNGAITLSLDESSYDATSKTLTTSALYGVMNTGSSLTLNLSAIEAFSSYNAGDSFTLVLTGLTQAEGYSTKGNFTATGWNVAYNTGTTDGTSLTLTKAAAVPEPATATLSLLALAGLAARRRRK